MSASRREWGGDDEGTGGVGPLLATLADAQIAVFDELAALAADVAEVQRRQSGTPHADGAGPRRRPHHRIGDSIDLTAEAVGLTVDPRGPTAVPRVLMADELPPM